MQKEGTQNNEELEEETDEAAEALLARFPDPDTDERLQVPARGDLPPVPEVSFTRPNTQTAQGGKPGFRQRGSGQTGGVTEEEAGEYRNMGIASTIGFSLVGSIIAGTILGLLVDKYVLHSTTMPWGLIVGFFAGVISGFVSLVRVTNRLNK